jgi:ribonucleoside-diphosphate reductase alpha chain
MTQQYVSDAPNNFRTELAASIFRSKYALTPDETWLQRCTTIVDDVCGTRGGSTHPLMSADERKELVRLMHKFVFLPGGRYIYYAGRGVSFYNNCFLFKGEADTREEWGRLLHSSSDALMSGGGIGIDYSVFRERGALLHRTGGTASGPIPLASSVNEHGRNVRQGGSRRSAIYASLNWQHGDAREWLTVKDWANNLVPGTNITYAEAKMNDFDAAAPLDFTNISLNYDNKFLATVLGVDVINIKNKDLVYSDAWSKAVASATLPSTFVENVRMAMYNGEPGFSFNFFEKEKETLRNACTEVCSEDDSDMCNIGSVNMAACGDIETFKTACALGSKFLICGTLRGTLPDEKTKLIREKNRRIGLGLMGMHEWMLQRGYSYGMSEELRSWMSVYKNDGERAAREHCDRFYINHPVAYRAVAPTGTIGTIAGTTTGLEPIFAVAYKRRYIDGNRLDGTETRRFQYYIDTAAQDLMDRYGVDGDSIETALDLAKDPERRVAFQADVQDYVDMGISSTLNLPAWGEADEDKVDEFARIIAKYAPRLRGLTMYPDGSRGGQPLVSVPLSEAKAAGIGVVFEENSDNACKSGVCGI